MTKKKIYLIVEEPNCESEGYYLSDPSAIEAFDHEEDAILALWYWYCDQIDLGFYASWDDDSVCSENDDLYYGNVDRYIIDVDLYGG